jgi:hypothetical protein
MKKYSISLARKGNVNQNTTDILSHHSQNGNNQENNQEQILERISGKGHLYPLGGNVN